MKTRSTKMSKITGTAISIAMLLLTMSTPAAFAQGIWEPCGGASGSLWSWAWAGNEGQNLTVVQGNFGKPIITRFEDLSGNGNHYFNTEGGRPSQPGYQEGLSLSRYGWSTSLPIIAVESYSDGTAIYGQLMFQSTSINADTFYLAAAVANTRTAGNRWLWGTDSSNYVKLDQSGNFIRAKIGGGSEIKLTDDGSLSKGPVLVEIWREPGGALRAYINGEDRTSGNPQSGSTFQVSGVGGPYEPGHSTGPGPADSAWDDHAFEYVACDGLPSQAQRDEVREYLRSKWSLFGSSGVTIRPNPPTGLAAQ
jgi:hypothetical protein